MIKNRFIDLLGKYTQSQNFILDCWDELSANYSSSARYYRNLKHVEVMLNEFQYIESEVLEKDALLFSIFYHDSIYQIYRDDNELQSALLLKERIIKTKFKLIEKCYAQILATRDHKISNDSDLNYLLDLDLVILGRPLVEYKEYMQNIRKEYQCFSNIEFKAGRRKTLLKFLAKPSIYKTIYFKNKYENSALLNIKYELDSLKQ